MSRTRTVLIPSSEATNITNFAERLMIVKDNTNNLPYLEWLKELFHTRALLRDLLMNDDFRDKFKHYDSYCNIYDRVITNQTPTFYSDVNNMILWINNHDNSQIQNNPEVMKQLHDYRSIASSFIASPSVKTHYALVCTRFDTFLTLTHSIVYPQSI